MGANRCAQKGERMSGENSKMSLKQKAAHDFKEFVVIFLYLAFFFCAFRRDI